MIFMRQVVVDDSGPDWVVEWIDPGGVERAKSFRDCSQCAAFMVALAMSRRRPFGRWHAPAVQ
jgi:hypothetical protein